MSRRKIILPIILFVVIIGLWEGVVRLVGVPEFLFPAPSRVVQFYFQFGYTLMGDTAATLMETLLGFVVAAVLGVLFAILLVYSALIYDIFYPPLVVLQVTPKIAIAPLLLLWFGYGLMPKVVIGFFISFFPIVVTTIHGLTSVEPEMLDLLHSLRASKWKVFWKARIPHALPYIFSGFQIAITLSLIGAIVAEFVGAELGLGFKIVYSQYSANTPMLFSALGLLAVTGLILFYLMMFLERLVTPWRALKKEKEFEAKGFL
ncbi:MAG: ABC transporter permease [Nitrospinota bacterium]